MISAAITTMPERASSLAAMQGTLSALEIPARVFPGSVTPNRLDGQRENCLSVLRWAGNALAPSDWLLYLEDDVSIALDAFRALAGTLDALARALRLDCIGLADRFPPRLNALRFGGYTLSTIIGKPFTDAVLVRRSAIRGLLTGSDASAGSDHVFDLGIRRAGLSYAQIEQPRIASDLRLPTILWTPAD